METELEQLMARFLNLLPPGRQRRISKEVTRYKANHGTMPCSTSIALWHLYRLGQLGSDDFLIRDAKPNDSSSSPFFADYVVSILPSRVEADEQRAIEDYLTHTSTQASIHRHYLVPDVKLDGYIKETLVKEVLQDLQ